MKKNTFDIFSIGLVIVLFSALGFAQETRRTVSEASSMYVVSAKAGGVNYVEGTVSVVRKKGTSGYLLKGDNLEIGDKVSTGADGKAEILLNPGSFARLGANTDFEFTTTSLEDLQLKLKRGSAMFEVITANDFTFAVNTPKAKFYIVSTGVYRVDVLKDGAGAIEVWKGLAEVGTNAAEVKSGRQATVNGNQVAVAKFDRGDKDALETFSKSRAKELAKVNARLAKSDVRTSLMSSFARNSWSLYDSFGLWVFNPFYGSYCFLPFGYGWNSPYGYYYPRDIWTYRLPPIVYNSPPRIPATLLNPIRRGTGNSSSSVSESGNTSTSAPPARLIPPFRRVQNDIGNDPTPMRQIDRSPSPLYIPYSPPPTAPPTVIAPAASSKRGNN
ncbi:MAG: FecR family protein [Pyrinomonadaceae bacterium]